MNRTLIRVSALLIFISVFLYIGETLKDLFYIIISIIILGATIDISKKKKEEEKL